jgi:hypothetical protein
MRRRTKRASGSAGDIGDSPVAVNARVRVYPGTDGEVGGTVVEDFGEMAGHAVDIGENHIVGPARRWAVGSTRAVWFSSTATSWRRVVLAVAVYPPSGDIFSSCGDAIGQ